MKKILFFALFVLLTLKGMMLYIGKFSQDSIRYEWPLREVYYKKSASVSSKPETEKLAPVFKQPFYYYSQGNQSYAFVSEDGNYILKLFKFDHLKPPLWFRWIPRIYPFTKLKDKKARSQSDRLQRLYRGHWVADTYNSDNCAILLSNMIPSPDFNALGSIHVVDRLGFFHAIDPQTTPFILQKKAMVARDLFNNSFQKRDIPAIKKLIDEIFELYLNEYGRGVYDRDTNVIDNIGFINQKAMRIDVGKLLYNPEIVRKETFLPDIEKKVVKRLKNWTHSHYPDFYEEVTDYLEDKLKAIKS